MEYLMKVQDEMIPVEARQFQDLFPGSPSAASAERIRESGAHLVRRIREHIAVEERNLFPWLEESSTK
jgi:hemerythrin-like domain-containing protein